MIPCISTSDAVSRVEKKNWETFSSVYLKLVVQPPDCYIPSVTKGAANFKSHDCISGLDKY